MVDYSKGTRMYWNDLEVRIIGIRFDMPSFTRIECVHDGLILDVPTVELVSR